MNGESDSKPWKSQCRAERGDRLPPGSNPDESIPPVCISLARSLRQRSGPKSASDSLSSSSRPLTHFVRFTPPQPPPHSTAETLVRGESVRPGLTTHDFMLILIRRRIGFIQTHSTVGANFPSSTSVLDDSGRRPGGCRSRLRSDGSTVVRYASSDHTPALNKALLMGGGICRNVRG